MSPELPSHPNVVCVCVSWTGVEAKWSETGKPHILRKRVCIVAKMENSKFYVYLNVKEVGMQ